MQYFPDAIQAQVLDFIIFFLFLFSVAAGISKGFAVANFLVKQSFLIHPTVEADGVGSRSIGR